VACFRGEREEKSLEGPSLKRGKVKWIKFLDKGKKSRILFLTGGGEVSKAYWRGERKSNLRIVKEEERECIVCSKQGEKRGGLSSRKGRTPYLPSMIV